MTAYGQDSLHKGMLKSTQNILWSTKESTKSHFLSAARRVKIVLYILIVVCVQSDFKKGAKLRIMILHQIKCCYI